MVQRVLMTELAHGLIFEGELETASRILNGLAHKLRIELTDADREILCARFPRSPAGLEQLWRVICPEDEAIEAVALGL